MKEKSIPGAAFALLAGLLCLCSAELSRALFLAGGLLFSLLWARAGKQALRALCVLLPVSFLSLAVQSLVSLSLPGPALLRQMAGLFLSAWSFWGVCSLWTGAPAGSGGGLLSRAAPRTALSLSAAAHAAPGALRRMGRTRALWRLQTGKEPSLRQASGLFARAAAFALEATLDAAVGLQSRGHGLPARRRAVRLSGRDGGTCAAILIFFGLSFLPGLWGALSGGLLLALPGLRNGWEAIQWTQSERKI